MQVNKLSKNKSLYILQLSFSSQLILFKGSLDVFTGENNKINGNTLG